jgi:hypothetical protein
VTVTSSGQARSFRVPVGGERDGTAPLTWGQEAIWRVMAMMGENSAWLSLRRLIVVPDGTDVTVERCADAVAAVIARHESLRTRIVDIGSRPHQVVDRQGEQPIEVVDLAAAPGEPAKPAREYNTSVEMPAAHADYLDRLVVDQAGEPFASADEWPVRATAVTVEGTVRYLSLVVNHVAADWHAVNIVVQELRRLLQGRSLAPVRGERPLDLAAREQEDRRRTARAIAHWRTAYERLSADGPPAEQLPIVAEPSQPPHLEVLLRSEALAIGLDVVAAVHDVTTTTVLTAAVCAVLGEMTGQDSVGMQSIVSNRFQPGHDLIISPMSQLALLVLDVGSADLDRPASLHDLVPQAWQRSLQAMRHARYDQAEMDIFLDGLLGEARRGSRADVDPSCCFNDLRARRPVGRLRMPADLLEVAAERSVVERKGLDNHNWDCWLEARDVPEGAGFSVIADTRRLVPDRIEWMVKAVEQYVVGAAAAVTWNEEDVWR